MSDVAAIRKKPGARVDEILSKACMLLYRDGYSSFNLRKLAAEVGLNLGAVQYYFPSREALIAEALKKIGKDWETTYSEAGVHSSNVSAEDRIFRILELNMRAFHEPENALLVHEMTVTTDKEPCLHDIVRGFLSRYLDLYVDLLRQLCPSAPEELIRSTALCCAAQVEGLILMMRARPAESADFESLKRVCRLQLQALIAQLKASSGR